MTKILNLDFDPKRIPVQWDNFIFRDSVPTIGQKYDAELAKWKIKVHFNSRGIQAEFETLEDYTHFMLYWS